MFNIKYKVLLTTANIIAAFLFLNNVVFADINNITQISFVSSEQVIKKDDISKVFTIQTQNTNGEAEEITESTNKLTLSTDSSTGEFSSSNTDWKSANTITMNKGTKNKNFYYRDSSVGNFIITAKLVSGETGKTWTTTQTIIILNDSNDNPINDDNSTSTSATSTISTNSTSTVATTTTTTHIKTKGVYISTHSSSEDLSDYVTGDSFEISAGRDRISYVGIPINFNAKHNKKDKRANFTWSFGDGATDIGQDVIHTYENTGDYIVILNSKSGIDNAVSRVNIRVLSPEIKIGLVSNGLKIKNEGGYEINIGDWDISDGRNDFSIPRDTIIGSNSEIVISDRFFSDFYKNNLHLKNQSNYVFTINNEETPILPSDSVRDIVEKEIEEILGMSIKDAKNIVHSYKRDMEIHAEIEKNKKFTDTTNETIHDENNDNISVATVIESVKPTDSTTTNTFSKKPFYSSFKKILNRFYDL